MLITIRTVAVSVRPPLLTLHRDIEESDINVVMTCIEAAVPYLLPYEFVSRIASPLPSYSIKPIVGGWRENNGMSMG